MDNREKKLVLSDIIRILKKNIVIIIASGVLMGVVFGVVTYFFVTPKYQSFTKSLVINQQDSNALTYSDFQSSTQFIEDYSEVVKSRNVLESVIDKLQLKESLTDLVEMADVSIINDTHLLKITVTADDPVKAQMIAEEITVTASVTFEEVMKKNAVSIIDHANLPENQSSPDLKLNIILGLIVGLVLCMISVLTIELYDTRINTAEDFIELFDYPVLSIIPYDHKLKIQQKGGKRR